MVPRATYGDVALVRRSALSGDWRPMPSPWWTAHGVQAGAVKACQGYDCIGPTLVTRPGLPLVQQFRQAAILGGAGGVQLETEYEMSNAHTTIDLGNGVTVMTGGNGLNSNTPTITVPPGPQPMQAASPPPPPPPAGKNGPPGSDTGPPEAEETTTLEDLDKRVSALEDTVGQIVDMINQSQAAAMAAIERQAKALPPEDEADPKV
jgi:hypothetical protein